MRGVSRQANKLPTPNQSSLTILSEELASPTDIKFVSYVEQNAHNTQSVYNAVTGVSATAITSPLSLPPLDDRPH